MTKRLAPFAAAIAAALLPAPALANDTQMEWALGGIIYKQNPAISMDSEELFISADEIRVEYDYTNHSDEAQTVMVSFPLPLFPNDEDKWWDSQYFPDWSDLEFETKVAGEVVDWKVIDRAVIGSDDVTALVEAEGFPVRWWDQFDFLEWIDTLAPEDAQRLAELGLLEPDPDEFRTWMPAWQSQRLITREQTFAPNATVHVSHRYAPYTGGTVGGLLHEVAAGEYPDAKEEYERRFCTDADFFAGVAKRNAKEAAAHGEGWWYNETWVGYVLSTGANWAGPIGKFRLVVDKEQPDHLVSFCMDGVTKISPTEFEVTKTGYEPDHDLSILIVSWYSPDDE